MNQDNSFTSTLQAWLNTPDEQKNWDYGALMLLQLSGNRIMYHNISINPRGKSEFIKGQLQKYLNFRLQQLTHDEVESMQVKVDEIAKSVIKPDVVILPVDAASLVNQTSVSPNKSAEYADFKAGKRADHDSLPEDIQALYVENLDIVHRMRELHMKLRSLSLDSATCPDSERYPFLKEIIALDKKRVQNWDIYDHYVPAAQSPTSVNPNSEEVNPATAAVNPEAEAVNPTDNSVNPTPVEQEPAVNPEDLTEAPAPKKAKAATKRTTKKTANKA